MTKAQIALGAVLALLLVLMTLQLGTAPHDTTLSNQSLSSSDPTNHAPRPHSARRPRPGVRGEGANVEGDAADDTDESEGDADDGEGVEKAAQQRRSGITSTGGRRRPIPPRDRDAPDLRIEGSLPDSRAAGLRRNAPILGVASNVPPTPVPAVPAEPQYPVLQDVPATDVLYDSGDDTQFRSDDQVEVKHPGKIEGASGTITFDVKPQWDESTGYADFVALGDNARVTKVGNLLQFEVVDAGGVRHVVNTKIEQWAPEQAQQIAATWDDKQLYLYVNGSLVSTDGIEHPIQIAEDATLRIGSSYPDGRPIAPATISRVRLRDELFVPATVDDAKS